MNTEHIKEISSQRIIRVVFLFPKHDAHGTAPIVTRNTPGMMYIKIPTLTT